jgi:lipoprotein-anchoring transpeptidase ErfK/SrfK
MYFDANSSAGAAAIHCGTRECTIMRVFALSLAAAIVLAVMPVAAMAGVRVEIDVGSQTMDVYVGGGLRYTWRVSTGRNGYETPGGTFRARRLEEEWYSTQYDDAPMPHAIFFNGGIAIHGTYDTKRLGRAASHGCVRLSPGHAARLYSLVEQHGPGNTVIEVND